MTYQRIETSTVGTDLTRALRGEIADPLWFLGRQWQVGELQGEDGGRAVTLRIESRRARPTHLRGGPADAPRGDATDLVDGPLEPQIEGEARLTGPGRTMWSARLGVDLIRRLREAGVGAATIDRLRDEHELSVPRGLRPIDRLLVGRSLDALALAEAFDAGKVDLSQRATRIVSAWAGEVAAQRSVGATSGELSTWDAERQEYQFHLIDGDGDDPDVTLDAAEYHGRRADWFAFDVDRSPRFDERLAKQPPSVDEVIATPIDFSGTPANRWWAIEDDEASLGHLDGTDIDLARAIVAGFVTTFGSDWLMAPLGAELGDLVEVSSIEVTDSFGRTYSIPSMAALDHHEDPGRPWRFFELTGDTGPAAGRAPLLYLTPTAADVLAGRDLERVMLAHDEVSNLGWAIEEVVESIAARPHDRTAGDRRDEHPPVTPGSSDDGESGDGVMRFRLDPEVPEHWLPLVPVRRTGDAGRWRQRGRVTPPHDAPDDWGEAHGLLLEPWTRLLLYEEEVPRAGAVVSRRARSTRRHDGAPIVWVGRRKRLGARRPSGAYLPDQLDGTPNDANRS